MATKKQKRAAAEARHERFMEAYRRDGLAALQKDRERRERENRQAKAAAKRLQASSAHKTLNAMFQREK